MKPLNKKKYPHLSEIQKDHESKDMDKLGEEIISLTTKYGLDMKEISALMFYVTQQTIQAPHNALFLKERLGLDVSNLGVEGILKVQQALVTIYLEELQKGK
ncbi:hypothetical protein [Vagococcus fluvialis]|uniref:hypothetical protein n=1 Tax=Vagococcus fluvialis TaxID=2738 RepID=UPI002B30A493|nr:hypothetical protein QDW48_06415 [Vagococcus fluvialis]